MTTYRIEALDLTTGRTYRSIETVSPAVAVNDLESFRNCYGLANPVVVAREPDGTQHIFAR